MAVGGCAPGEEDKRVLLDVVGADGVQHLVADIGAHAPMMVAHLLAAALVGCWLAVGERAAWSFVRLTARRAQVPVLPTHRTSAPVGWSPVRPAPRALWRRGPLPRRGPPVLV